MRALAPRLPADLAAKGFAKVDELRNPSNRADVLAALVPRLEGKVRDQAVRTTIAAAFEIDYA
jgi:hypothetical protein